MHIMVAQTTTAEEAEGRHSSVRHRTFWVMNQIGALPLVHAPVRGEVAQVGTLEGDLKPKQALHLVLRLRNHRAFDDRRCGQGNSRQGLNQMAPAGSTSDRDEGQG